MPTDAVELASHQCFTATWSAASMDQDLGRWSAFLAQHGVVWSASPKDRDFVDQVLRSSPQRGGEMVQLRLGKLANDVLSQAGDARRVCQRVSGEPPRAWYVLSSEQRSVLEASGHRFDTGASGALRQFATIPVTLGVFFAAQYGCRAAGINPDLAWGVALVAYALTVRVVRGRWPLQRQ